MQEEKNWKIKNGHRFSICNFEEWPTDRVLYVITKWFTKFSYPWCSAKNTWLHFQNGYKTMKEKCRYGERFLYFSHCCDACLLNSALDEQANYCSSNSLICPNFLVDLQKISGGFWSFVLRRYCWESWKVNSFKIWCPKLNFSQVIFEEIWDVVRRFGSLLG